MDQQPLKFQFWFFSLINLVCIYIFASYNYWISGDGISSLFDISYYGNIENDLLFRSARGEAVAAEYFWTLTSLFFHIFSISLIYQAFIKRNTIAYYRFICNLSFVIVIQFCLHGFILSTFGYLWYERAISLTEKFAQIMPHIFILVIALLSRFHFPFYETETHFQNRLRFN